MTTRNWKRLAAGLIVLLGSLQAWDSGAFSAAAGTVATVLAGLGVAVPAAAALLSERRAIHLWAVVASGMLLVAARTVSAVPLPELLLAAFFPTMMLLVWGRLRELRLGRSNDGAPVT